MIPIWLYLKITAGTKRAADCQIPNHFRLADVLTNDNTHPNVRGHNMVRGFSGIF